MSPWKVFTAAAASLAPWAPSLQRLSLCLSRPPGDSLEWLGGLQQLTWLHLALHLAEPPLVALDWLGSLQRLRTLHWQVLYQGAPTGVLPPLPTGLEHLLLSGGCLYHMNGLGRLTALQTVVCCSSTGCHTQLPPGLSTLASLRYLHATSMSNTVRELGYLPQLEWLCLRGLAELPPLLPASLRVLDVRGNHCTIPAGAPWLPALEQLGCGIGQVSAQVPCLWPAASMLAATMHGPRAPAPPYPA